MEELAQEFPDGAVNEKMCNGKIREVQGRRMVRNEKVILNTLMEKKAADVEPRGVMVTKEASKRELAPKHRGQPSGYPECPSTCDARRRAKTKEPLAKDVPTKTKKDPSLEEDSVPRAELEDAWIHIQEQESKVAALKAKLAAALGTEVDDSDLDTERMSTTSGKDTK